MQLTLTYFDLMEAIHAHLKSKNIEWRHAEYDDIWIKFEKPVWAEKKHKNGKVVKCKHGYPEREIVKWETISEHFGEMDEMQIYYDKNGIYPIKEKEE